MNFRAGIIVVLFGIVALIVSAPGLSGEERVHLVQRGETLFSIARANEIRVDDLMRHNGITDPARLQAGQRLRIPVIGTAGSAAQAARAPSAEPASARGEYSIYRAVRGDTFFSIARRFSVSVDALQRVNNLPENYMLREGDSLRLPADAIIPPEVRVTVAGNTPVAAAAERAPQSQAPQARTEPSNEIRQLTWPVNVLEFNYMTGKLSGVLITGMRGESVRSLTYGTVISAGPFQGFGRVVIIQVEGGYLYVYGGCESLTVKEGDRVRPGTVLGRLGIDAKSDKPQLFFMVYRRNLPIDPVTALRS
jgi:murein DD-endopeptidase MepM/ murein hydrolase activator NlpD